MKNLLASAAACAGALVLGIAMPCASTAATAAGDAVAGKATFTANCASCHQPGAGPYAGKTPAELTAAIQGIESGSIKHSKKIGLNATDIANVVAYIAPAAK
jgi:mono/diheme cytochrome c family protein